MTGAHHLLGSTWLPSALVLGTEMLLLTGVIECSSSSGTFSGVATERPRQVGADADSIIRPLGP